MSQAIQNHYNRVFIEKTQPEVIHPPEYYLEAVKSMYAIHSDSWNSENSVTVTGKINQSPTNTTKPNRKQAARRPNISYKNPAVGRPTSLPGNEGDTLKRKYEQIELDFQKPTQVSYFQKWKNDKLKNKLKNARRAPNNPH